MFDGVPVDPPDGLMIRRETFAQVEPDLPELCAAFYRDASAQQNLPPFDPNYAAYRRIEGFNALRVFTVRQGSTLLGTLIFFLAPNLHHRTSMWATCDMIWLRPDARRPYVATRLIRTAEQHLAAEGVATVQIASKAYMPALARLLTHMGYDAPEIIHQKVLA